MSDRELFFCIGLFILLGVIDRNKTITQIRAGVWVVKVGGVLVGSAGTFADAQLLCSQAVA